MNLTTILRLAIPRLSALLLAIGHLTEAADIMLSPDKGTLARILADSQKLSVTFPTPMVDLDHLGPQRCPLVFDPPLEVDWIWESETEGRVIAPTDFAPENSTVFLRRIMYRARLRDGLKDLAGQAVGPRNWAVQFADDTFAVSGVEFLNAVRPESRRLAISEPRDPDTGAPAPVNHDDDIEKRGDREPLPARPRVRIEFSRDVTVKEAEKNVVFRDTSGREEIPVEAAVEGFKKDAPRGWIIVEPVRPLPEGRTYYLVIKRFAEPAGKKLLPDDQKIVPAGTTHPLAIKVIAGFQQPGTGAFVRIHANKPLAPGAATAATVTVTPAVADLRIAPAKLDGRTIELHGRFDPKAMYKVVVKAGVKSVDQFALAKDSVWTVRFAGKRPAVIVQEPLVFQRATGRGVALPLVQVNTGALTWKIAAIPPGKFATVWSRLREFGDFQRDQNHDPITDLEKGEHRMVPTKLLIPGELPKILKEGTFDASGGDRETAREILWTPPDQEPGLYLIEISGQDAKGRFVGNRAIVSRGDWVINAISSPAAYTVRLARMSDGRPVPGVPVQVLAPDGRELAPVLSDAHGEASFDPALLGELQKARAIFAGKPGAQCLQLGDRTDFQAGDFTTDFAYEAECGLVITDRNLYRPGETVKIKGIERTRAAGQLAFPELAEVEWTVLSESFDSEIVHTGKARVSKRGNWEASWEVPASLLGRFTIRGQGGSAKIGVAEIRPLPFSVQVETANTYGDTVTAKVTSTFFHGAPNAGATVRWKAVWSIKDRGTGADETEGAVDQGLMLPAIASGPETSMVLSDQFSPDSPQRGVSAYVLSGYAKAGWDISHGTGQAREVGRSETPPTADQTLDAQGTVTLTSKSPFRPGAHRRAEVTWVVDVLSKKAAQQVRGGAVARVQFVPKILGAQLAAPDENSIQLQAAAFDLDDAPAAGVAVKAEVFRVSVKTVKEPIGGNINRYQNFPEFTKVWEKSLVTPALEKIPVTRAGQYVARLTAPGQPLVPQVSARTLVGGDEEVALPVENATALAVSPDRKRYRAGDTASLAMESPFTGVATVTVVAAERVLARQIVEVKGNAQRVSLKILPEFAPNAHVLVHLVKAAGPDGLPAERFGSCEIAVERTARLEAALEVSRDAVEPGAEIAGVLRVLDAGKPVSGAEVLLFAADDAILELGRWTAPDFADAFFPRRPLQVRTASAGLDSYEAVAAGGVPSLGQKGFILGASALLKGDLADVDAFRRSPRAFNFWKPAETTGPNGEVRFAFKAAESLTRCRIVAVVQSGTDRFATAEKTVLLAKHLQIEPLLPDFVRRGDELALRATVQQDYAESDEVEIGLVLKNLGKALEPLDREPIRRVLKRGQRETVGFRVRVVPGPASARIVLSAQSLTQPAMHDSEDHTVPVRAATIEIREAEAGALTGAPFDAVAARPPRWSAGRCDVLLSNSSYLARLAGLPAVVEARGSLEKLSTRLLAGTLLAETLAFVPLPEREEKEFRTGLEKGLALIERSFLEDDRLPCFEGAREANDFVTVQTAWAILSARKQKLAVKDTLRDRLRHSLYECVRRSDPFERASADVRCFAFMALARTLAEGEEFSADLLEEVESILAATQELTDEGRAWLALGLHAARQRREVRDDLLRAIGKSAQKREFDPKTFGSPTREKAVRLLAQSEINATKWTAKDRETARQTLDALTKSAGSSQEHLWLLLVLNSMSRGELIQAQTLKGTTLTPKPALISANAKSVGWLGVPLADFPTQFPAPLKPGIKGSYLMRATYLPAEGDARPPDPRLSLERSVRLIEPAGARNGSAQSPWKLGDHVLVTFTISATIPHSYVELEDLLPACFETVNPQLPLIREHFKLPIETGAQTLALSNSELRSDRTVLYFEQTKPGRNTYGVLARVAAPGVFQWPRSQVRPMYDSSFGGVSEAAVVHAVE